MCSLDMELYASGGSSANPVLQGLGKLSSKMRLCLDSATTTVSASNKVTQTCSPAALRCSVFQPDSNTSLCVSTLAPTRLLAQLLGPSRACPTAHSDDSNKIQWAKSYVNSAWRWELACDRLNLTSLASALASNLTWADAAAYSQAELQTTLRSFAKAQTDCHSYTTEQECSSAIAPVPAAACGSRTLDELGADCCATLDVVDLRNKNTSGHLPSTFTPARIFTDLSLNPELCGTIKSLPARSTSTPVVDTSPPLALVRSQVALDLPSIGRQSSLVGAQVAYWLGNLSAITYYNLAGPLPSEQSYQSCVLLREGSLTVLAANYCSQKDPNCTCKVGARAASVFSGRDAWDACHTQELHLEFESPWRSRLAMAQYNKHMANVDPASDCGSGGVSHRQKVAGRTWGITVAACTVVGILWYLCYEWLQKCGTACYDCLCCCCGGRSDDSKASHAVLTVIYVLLHAYDMYGDWMYIRTVAEGGNLHVLKILGWLLTAPYLCVLLLAACVAMVVLVSLWMDDPERWWFLLFLLVVPFGVVVSGVVLPAIATKNLVTFTSNVIVSPEDCLFLAKLLMGFSLAIQGVLALVGAGIKYKVLYISPKTLKRYNGADHALAAVVSEGLFLVLENIPQAIAQTVFWVNGQALVPTKWFIISAVGSIAGIFFTVVGMLVRSKARRIVKRKAARQERQLEMSTGSNKPVVV